MRVASSEHRPRLDRRPRRGIGDGERAVGGGSGSHERHRCGRRRGDRCDVGDGTTPGPLGVWSPAVLVLGVVAVANVGVRFARQCAVQHRFAVPAPRTCASLTAVLALAWVDSAYAASDPEHAPRMFRRFTDRRIGMLAGGLVLGFHRSIDVAWRERLLTHRPVLVVANHGNGFVDPVVVAAVLDVFPFPRQGDAVEGGHRSAVPRSRGGAPRLSQRGRRPAEQQRLVLKACHRELAQGATVAIFPKGPLATAPGSIGSSQGPHVNRTRRRPRRLPTS